MPPNPDVPVVVHDVDPAGGAAAAGPLAPDVEIQPSGSSTTPAPVVDVEPVQESMAPPPERKEVVLGLPAQSAPPLAAPKGRKRPCPNPEAAKRRRCTKESEAGPSKVSGLASRHRAKFVSLIDGMISECGSEVERLAKELAESHEKLAQFDEKLRVIEGTHSQETARFESQIVELERDLGKTASCLLKAKDAKKAKSEVRKLKRELKSAEESAASAIADAREEVRAEFRAFMAKVAGSLDSLATVHARDLSLAVIEGSLSEALLFQGEAPPSPRAEGARISVRKEELASVEGNFGQIIED